MKTLVIAISLIVISFPNVYAKDCKIKIQKMDGFGRIDHTSGYDFSKVGTEPIREGTAWSVRSKDVFYFNEDTAEKCKLRGESFIEKYGNKRIKYLSIKFNGELTKLTDKHRSRKLFKSGNLTGTWLEKFIYQYDIVDSIDPGFHMTFNSSMF